MLFNSNAFIFLFLPVTLALFFLFSRRPSAKSSIAFLTLASLFFYGRWRPAYLLLIVISVLANYAVGTKLSRMEAGLKKKLLLALGVAGNLAVLGYYKYTNFVVDNLNEALGWHMAVDKITLPLAISFFTFQKVGYLCDSAQGKTKGYGFLEYLLFVSFFPQLIAGPIVHHAEVVPQFRGKKWHQFSQADFYVGLTIFVMGLFKKVVIADGVSVYATPAFELAGKGEISSLAAWLGALSYTFQLYFDFSGYSDMAIGLARMFGIYLPLNFNAPYRAGSIIEFWRRWHMTLSRFLKEYLYIPLGGNRRGPARRHINLMATMVLGGIWHGANWTFLIWGALHGAYLAVNHAWRHVYKSARGGAAGAFAARVLTFLCVVVAWVFFKANSVGDALHVLRAMFGVGGIVMPEGMMAASSHVRLVHEVYAYADAAWWVAGLFLISMFAPSTQQMMRRFRPALDAAEVEPFRYGFVEWKPSALWAVVVFSLFCAVQYKMGGPAEFLYFNF
jgi:D-alanyl-lipoteichoic acid acyltransferase DltB (MBOAT superfamily)